MLVVRRVLAVAVPVALTLAVAPAPGSAQDTPPGTVVLPPRYSAEPATVQRLSTSASAVLYRRNEGGDVQLALRRVGGERVLTPRAATPEASVAGDEVAVEVAVPGGSGYRAQVLDLATGTSVLSDPYPSRGARGTATDYFLAPTGDGWLDVRGPGGAQALRRWYADGRPSTAVRPLSHIVVAAVADRTGALLLEEVGQVGEDQLSYVDLATGTSTVLWRYDDGGASTVGGLSLSPHAVGWLDGSRGLSKAPRDALTSPVVRPEAARAVAAVVTDTATAWIAPTGSDPDAPQARVVTALDGAAPVPGPAVAADSVGLGVVDAGDLAVVAGETGSTRGVYRLAVGATSYGEVLDAAGAAPPLSIEAAAGRIAYTYPGAKAGQDGLFDQGLQRDAGSLAARGAERQVGTSVVDYAATSPRTAYLLQDVTGQKVTVVVKDGTTTTAQLPVEPGTYGVAVSGNHLVTLAAYLGPDAASGSTSIRDLRDLSAPPVVLARHATLQLSGSRLAFLERDGSIHVRDLDTGAPDVVVRQPGFPAGAETDGRQERMTLLLAGDRVLWSFPSDQPQGADGRTPPDVETRAARVSDGGRTSLAVPASTADELRLADGLAAWTDRETREVHLFDLSRAADSIVGTARRPAVNRTYLALDDDYLAFVAPDDTTHVLPNRAAADAPPVLLGGTPSTAFSPDGDGSGDRFALGLDASRPLTGYDVTVRDAGGVVVRSFSATAPDGGLRAQWDGRDSAGQPMPDGRYTWSVSGDGGPERGLLAPGRGSTARLTGDVRIDRVAPSSARVVPPARSSDTSATSAFRVAWSGSEPGLRYDVNVARRDPASLSFGAARRWLTATSQPSGLYTGAAQGDELRFTVTARDAAGNHRTASATTVVPYDDTRSTIRYSPGWTTAKASDRWLGSSHVASAAGRSLTLTVPGTRFDVVGDRCPTCGRFRLVVDGKTRPVVSSAGSSTLRRQVLASVVVPRGRHTVQLQVVATSGRSVRVDAVAVTR